MKSNRLFTMLVLVCLALLATAANAQNIEELDYPELGKVNIPEITKVTLDNGMRLYVVEDREFPIFRMSVRVLAGSYLESDDKVGMVDILGTTLRTGGTQKYTGDQIDEMLEAVGASVETWGDLTACGASVNTLSDYTDLGLEVLAEILRRPMFDEDKIELAKVQQRSAISRRNDDPQTIGSREFYKAIYGPNSVYARHTEYKTVNAVTQDDLAAYHQKYFKPENVQMAIWGDFDKDEIVTKIKQYFGDWQQGGTPVPPPPDVEYDWNRHVYLANKTDINQSSIYVGHIGGVVTDGDYPARIVMNNIMGGGLGNRMFNAVRSREGLAYTAFGVYTSNYTYPGIFYNYTATKSETTGKAVKEVVKVIESMQTDPPTDAEMRKGKDSYLNSFVFNFDSKSEVVNRLMTYDRYGLPEDFLQQTKESIETVTADDVVAAAKANLKPDQLKVLVVGNSEDFDMPLDSLNMGPVTEIDITIPPAEEETELVINEANVEKGNAALQRAVEAHGGHANFAKINNLSMSGTFTLNTPQGEFPIQIQEVVEYPDKQMTLATVMGRKIYSIRAGEKGWKTDQASGGIVEKTSEDIADDLLSMRRDEVYLFQHIDDPYFKAVYDGTGDVNGTNVEYVALVDDEGERIARLAIDAQSGKLVAKYHQGETPMGEGMVETIYQGFTDVMGAQVPTSLVQNLSGQKVGSIVYEDVQANTDIPAETFSQPTQ